MFNQINFSQLDFKYIFPDSKTIQYCSSCVINRSIKKYLDKKKLKIINKLVHIFLEDSINEAKKKYITNKTQNSSTEIICRGDQVITMYGKGVVKDILSDDIIIIVLNKNITKEIYTYLKRKYVSLLYNNNEISEDIRENSRESESSEEYSNDFSTESLTSEDSEDELDHLVDNDVYTITINYMSTFYNFIKTSIFG